MIEQVQVDGHLLGVVNAVQAVHVDAVNIGTELEEAGLTVDRPVAGQLSLELQTEAIATVETGIADMDLVTEKDRP